MLISEIFYRKLLFINTCFFFNKILQIVEKEINKIIDLYIII